MNTFLSNIRSNVVVDSIVDQYHYFRSLNKISQIFIVASSLGGGTAYYTYSHAVIPSLISSVCLGILGGMMASKASFKIEDKKAIRIYRNQFFDKIFDAFERMIGVFEKDTNRLFQLAKEKTEKAYADQKGKTKSKEKPTDVDLETIESQLKKKYKGDVLKAKIASERVKYYTSKFVKTLQKGTSDEFAEKMKKIDELKDQIQPVEEDNNPNVDEAKNSNNGQTKINKFSQKFSMLMDTCDGGTKAFIGGSSMLYIILSNSLGMNYTSPEVLAPCVLTGFGASGFGAKRGYNDHQVDVEEAQQYKEAEVRFSKLEARFNRIIQINTEIKKILFNLEEESDDYKLQMMPKEEREQVVECKSPVLRFSSFMNMFKPNSPSQLPNDIAISINSPAKKYEGQNSLQIPHANSITTSPSADESTSTSLPGSTIPIAHSNSDDDLKVPPRVHKDFNSAARKKKNKKGLNKSKTVVGDNSSLPI